MTEVIGVRFKQVGKVYYFAPNGEPLRLGEKVIVETSRGIECGEVAMLSRQVKDEDVVKPLKTVIPWLWNVFMKPITSTDWV